MDRRIHPRYHAIHRVCASIVPRHYGDSDRQVFYCTTRDVSAGGVQLAGDACFAPGQLIELLVVCGSAYKGFQFMGRVAWIRQDNRREPTTTGVEFFGVRDATHLAWLEMLDWLRNGVPADRMAPKATGEP